MRAAAAKRRLAEQFTLQAWKQVRPRYWRAQPVSGLIVAEVLGDPVKQLILSVPVVRGAGEVIGDFLEEYAGEAARLWVADRIRAHAKRLEDDAGRPLDEIRRRDGAWVRVQILGNLIVVSVGMAG